MSSKETIVLGGGCFWCTEAIFEALRGVVSVMPGYAGGVIAEPTYEQVCQGSTGHAEVIRVEFDPAVISLRDILVVFFASHDPTTLNRQGADVGTQYRSVIFFTQQDQAPVINAMIAELSAEGSKVVTEVAPLTTFYPAEEYHRAYYRNNTKAGYCQVVISPKLAHLKERFHQLIK